MKIMKINYCNQRKDIFKSLYTKDLDKLEELTKNSL